MDFGYNTDVVYEGDDYHVQTEGKFGKSPRIDTLVYRSGSVLHKLSRPQEQLSAAPTQREASQKLIKKQHLRVVSLIRKGNFERLEYEIAHPGEPPPTAGAQPRESLPIPVPPEGSDFGEATMIMKRPLIPKRRPTPPPQPTPPPPIATVDSFLEDSTPVPAPAPAPEPEPEPEPTTPPVSYATAELAPPQAPDTLPDDGFDSPFVDADVVDEVSEEEIDDGPVLPPAEEAKLATSGSGEEAPAAPSVEERGHYEDATVTLDRPYESEAHASSPPPVPASPIAESGIDSPAATEEEPSFDRAAPDDDADLTLLAPVASSAAREQDSSEDRTVMLPPPAAPDPDDRTLMIDPPAPVEASPLAPPGPPPTPAVVASRERPTPKPAAPLPDRPSSQRLRPPQPPQARGKSRAPLLVGIGAVLVIGALTIIVALVMMVSGSGKGEDPAPTVAPTSAPTAPSSPSAAGSPTPAPPASPAAAESGDAKALIASARKAAAAGETVRALSLLDGAAGGAVDVAKGRLLERMGRYEEAVLTFRRAASQGKETAPEALYLLGETSLKASDAGEARRALEELERLGPGPEVAYLKPLLEGRLRFSEGRTDDAAALIRKAISLSPQDARGYHAMGDILLELGLKNNLSTFLVNARDSFGKALARDPDDVDLAVSLARLDLAARDMAAAKRRLERAIATDASSYEANLMLGEVELRLGSARAAIAPFAAAAKLGPSRPEAHLLAGTAAARGGDPRLAVEHFLASLVAMKKPEYLPYPGIHASRDELKELISQTIKKALQENPDNKKALNLLDITVNLK